MDDSRSQRSLGTERSQVPPTGLVLRALLALPKAQFLISEDQCSPINKLPALRARRWALQGLLVGWHFSSFQKLG
jgi:hypothetical protein